MNKLGQYAIIAFLIFFVITNPSGADHFAQSALHGLNTLAHSLSNFVSHL